jgi:hypothetical protein
VAKKKSSGVKFPDVKVQLTGTDGNAFALIGRVTQAMKRAGYRKEAEELAREAMNCESYDALLQLLMATVGVS